MPRNSTQPIPAAPYMVSQFIGFDRMAATPSMVRPWLQSCTTSGVNPARFMNPTLGFLIGIAAWLYILGEVFFGRLGDINAKSGDEVTQTAFFWLRLIVTIGWAVYPLCNFIASFAGGVDEGKLSIVYNLADFVNQIAFGLIILTAAVRHSATVR